MMLLALSSCKKVSLYPYQSKETNKWGYVNKDSTFIIPPKFEVADDFKNGLARVAVTDKWGFITKGKLANLILTKPIESIASIPYNFGSNLIEKVFIRGVEI